MNSSQFPYFAPPTFPDRNLLASIEAAHKAKREEAMVDHGYAHILYERLMKQIADFEATLKPDEEIAAYLSSFGKEMLIQIETIGYHNPFFIVFAGRSVVDDRPVYLVQHTSQLSVLFTSIKVDEMSERHARRIGFDICANELD